jgi:16S rRNA (guanine966-N2)-methyltransferase
MPATATTRITGGEWRGRLVSTPTERLLRPTRAVVREALFNILGDRIVGARLADVFAGAGTVGFEALSRGAASALFVDRLPAALALVRRTAERLGCLDRCRLVRGDALGWVRSGAASDLAIDICFLDAPYADDVIDDVLAALGDAPPPLVVCEHHRARALPDRVGRLALVRRAHYGITDLSFLQAEDGSGDHHSEDRGTT